MSAPQRQTEIEESSEAVDEFAAALTWHVGDRDATIRTLLDDCKHLREQLALAGARMATGAPSAVAKRPRPRSTSFLPPRTQSAAMLSSVTGTSAP